jgi:hypothetical protein
MCVRGDWDTIESGEGRKKDPRVICGDPHPIQIQLLALRRTNLAITLANKEGGRTLVGNPASLRGVASQPATGTFGTRFDRIRIILTYPEPKFVSVIRILPITVEYSPTTTRYAYL